VSFRRLARAEEIPRGQTRWFELDGGPVVVANWNDAFYALAGVCPHRNLPLEGATLWDRYLTCPWHNFQYDVTSGENHYPRCVYPADMKDQVRGLTAYPVELRGEEIWVAVTEAEGW
jgi:nitrite reductase/ring-hydroxylating ferredoxin subunit